MGGLIENATSILRASQTRVEVAAQNISNITTPGYKRSVSFSQLLAEPSQTSIDAPAEATSTDFSQGKLINTGRPTDLAISGDGFFVVRSNDQLLYTRQGQFKIDSDGHMVTAEGYILQDQAGGDLVVSEADLRVLNDGVALNGDQPRGRIAVAEILNPEVLRATTGGAFAGSGVSTRPAENPSVRQGFQEASNVSTGDEMVTIMQALRSAETGQRLVTVYDDLMGRVLSTFGQA